MKGNITKACLPLNAWKRFSFFAKPIFDYPERFSVKTEKDYEEFLAVLNKHNVKYCIIGAFALAFYVEPRYTKDIDILIEASTENTKNILL